MRPASTGPHRLASSTETSPSSKSIHIREAFAFWLKLGVISFGGPTGQIAILHQELVERRRWISEHRFLHALNYCMLLPGPEAQQLATYLGWLMHGAWGGIVAGALFVLPSLAVLMTLAWIYVRFGSVPAVASLLYGIKPAIVAIVIFAAYRIGTRALKNRWLWTIAAASFIASVVLNAPFPLIVFSAALLGMVAGRFAPALFEQSPAHAATAAVVGPALIDDNTHLPAHAQLNWLRLSVYATVGIALWIGVLGALTVYFGWPATLPQMGWFFTKAALLTFGGAYAVLPYVYQGAVEHYQWLTAAQMMDGLALGESTPGPLIMIVAFVGFLGAYGQQVFGPDAVVLAGVTGACVATFFTFLPSFLFILVGAPFVEATRRDIKFAAPLTCITAAVVGVILSLAVFLAGHVLWPGHPGVGLDIFAASLGLAALVCLYRYKVNPLGILAVCALAGFVVRA